MTRIVQVANYVTEGSGGQRRTLLELGRRYAAAGHACTTIVPGERRHIASIDGVDVVTLPGVAVPTSGGYRTILRRRPLQRLLTGLGPDIVELSDKTTLSWLPAWLAAHGTPTVLLVHERHDQILQGTMPDWLPWRDVIRAWSARAASASAAVVCASEYAADQFAGIDARIERIPLGADIHTFRPPDDVAAADRAGPVELVYVGRLSVEKRPDLAVAALAELVGRGVGAHLRIIGDGPLRPQLVARSRGLPITFAGRIDDRRELASVIGSAAVAIAPCPVETFGLAVVEALACGTPVVTVDRGGARELIVDGAGVVASCDAGSIADAVQTLLAGNRTAQSARCRAAAEPYTWDRTANAMLALFERCGRRPAVRAA